MTSPFAINTPDTNVVLTENRLGEMRFIVTNMTDQPLQGRATVVPLDSAPPEWFSLASKAELNLRPGATAQVVVRIEPPLGVPPARHLFRVDVVNATAPEAAASVGPSCAVGAWVGLRVRRYLGSKTTALFLAILMGPVDLCHGRAAVEGDRQPHGHRAPGADPPHRGSWLAGSRSRPADPHPPPLASGSWSVAEVAS